MSRRPLFWLLICALCLASAFYGWRRGNDPAGQKAPHTVPAAPHSAANAPTLQRSNAFTYRLSNTPLSLSELAHRDHAILLENALIDTESAPNALHALPVPPNLRIHSVPPSTLDPRPSTLSYIIQSRGPLNNAFRALLQNSGATIVAYIPNNAYLVRATAATAQDLAAQPDTQVVLPYEPYYKLKPSLLKIALEAEDSSSSRFKVQSSMFNVPSPTAVAQEDAAHSPNSTFDVGSSTLDVQSSGSDVQSSKFNSLPTALSLLLFPDARDSTLSDLKALGLEILSEETSPFGPVIKVRSTLHAPRSTLLTSLARLPGIQEIEPASVRRPANDLTRAAIGVDSNTVTAENYLGLTGSNVLVNVNDTGVDATHPDFGLRVTGDSPVSLIDSNGHGTHVAGIIAGNGAQSATVTNASGSILPSVDGQFRGQAPAAGIFAASIAGASDVSLQQAAARTNALISNNSWTYSTAGYDLAAASYDAAVRDALPNVSGSQPVLFVFPAGNAGTLNLDAETDGDSSIPSPATAKNVITVGATEALRVITNQVWRSIYDGTNTICLTNQPWLASTDSTNQVTAFSRRGNVGIGIEGEFGRFKPDVVAPGSFIVSTRPANWNEAAYYHPATNSDYAGVLSNLNHSLGPFYRYESGASMSAAVVSGALALMQEFLEQRLGHSCSPALMKALLIIGARSVGEAYDFHVQSSTNLQGWGLIHLPNSIPAALSNLDLATAPMHLFDQSPTNALATGQSHTRRFALTPQARSQALRVTLVWTDPPGNPAAGLKLVNDLDLVVTNLDTGDVFFGNDIAAGNEFNQPWTNGAPNVDVVNNVENVYLSPLLGTNYSVTVTAHRVNVNAVTAQTNDVVQDYALVVSSGDGQIPDALTLTNDSPVAFTAAPNVTVLTNALAANPGLSGAVLTGQRVGANAPLLAGTNGLVNQWRFYVLTNDLNFTNAVFATFLPTNLALPPADGGQTNLVGAARAEADLDLYVSTNPALTNLDPAAIAGADKSLGRGGSEFVFYTNVAPGAVFFVGIKSEDQQAAEFGFLGVFSEAPFGARDDQGNLIVPGLPLPLDITPTTSAGPGVTTLFAFAPESMPLRRAVATNAITHANFTNLVVQLGHGRKQVVLDNHSPGGGGTNQTWIFEDNGAGDLPGSQPSDGPGSLRDFIGDEALGLWLVTVLDTSPINSGHVDGFALRLEPQSLDVNALVRTVLTNTFSYDSIDVPLGATNLTVCLSSNSEPVELYLRRGALPTRSVYDKTLLVYPSGDCLALALSDLPPLQPGRYFIGAFNPNSDPQDFVLQAVVTVEPDPVTPVSISSAGAVAILDDAITQASIFVTNQQRIAAVEVGLRVAHPRVSDLAFRLLSPGGTQVLLCENRGGSTSGGLGGDLLVTNVLPQVHSGDFNANTNIIQVGQSNGTVIVDYDFFSLPDTLHVYYDGSLIFDSGSVSNTGQFLVDFGPGASTELMIVMNEGNNTNLDSAWDYQASVVCPHFSYFIFTEDAAAAPVDIKFATPPFASGSLSNLFCRPEASLRTLAGENAYGNWTLEIYDSRAGATSPPPQVVSWQLRFVFENELPPTVITAAQVLTNNFCLTWTSLPGAQYHVQGKTNLTDAAWTVITPALTAPAHQTTWCLPLPSDYQYFRVQQ